MIHKDQYVDWKNHPVTEIYFKEIRELKEVIEEGLHGGRTLDSHARLAEQIGLLQGYESAMTYSPQFNDDGYMIDDGGEIVE